MKNGTHNQSLKRNYRDTKNHHPFGIVHRVRLCLRVCALIFSPGGTFLALRQPAGDLSSVKTTRLSDIRRTNAPPCQKRSDKRAASRIRQRHPKKKGRSKILAQSHERRNGPTTEGCANHRVKVPPCVFFSSLLCASGRYKKPSFVGPSRQCVTCECSEPSVATGDRKQEHRTQRAAASLHASKRIP